MTLKKQSSIELKEAYDIINKSNLVIFKWTLSEEVPTDFVSENISLFGYAPEDFYDGALRDYWEFVYPEDRERVKSELYKARSNGKTNYRNQYRVICKNGEIRWIEEWVIHERDAHGLLRHEKGIIRDITESIIISEKLKESEYRYKELFENAAAIIFTFNEAGEITRYNHSFEDLLQLTDSDIKLNIEDWIGVKTHLDLSNKSLFTYCSEQENAHFEIEMVRRDGKRYFVELRTRIVYVGGHVSEIQAVGNDISDKKFAEEQIKYLTEHDPLTGLYNRLYFDDQLALYEKKEISGVSIIVGDVNGLKMVNDAFGHKTGDQMLIAIADILKEIFNHPGDVIARLSGDEFAILTEVRNIPHYIDSIQKKCQELKQFSFIVDISLGVAIRKKANQSLDSVFREADHQMYRNKLRRTKKIKLKMIESLKSQLETKSIETAEHSQRMCEFSRRVGVYLNFSESILDELELATSMHDIGMVSVDRAILDKAGPLSESEFKEMMKHTEIGYHLLVASPSLAGIGEYVLSHHENYDGSGYPQGLARLEIPLISRVIAVVDGYEAMTHERSYRKKLSHEEALSEIMSCSGTKYDPNIVLAFINIFKEE